MKLPNEGAFNPFCFGFYQTVNGLLECRAFCVDQDTAPGFWERTIEIGNDWVQFMRSLWRD
jgi:hypothetical protein